MSKDDLNYVICFVKLNTYMILNVSDIFNDIYTEKSLILFKVTVQFIWSPVNGPISPLPALVSIAFRETPDDTSESEERNQQTS